MQLSGGRKHVVTQLLCAADELKLVADGVSKTFYLHLKKLCFGTEHRRGATLSEVESEAESLDEPVGSAEEEYTKTRKPHSLTGPEPGCCGVGVGCSLRWRISPCGCTQH